MPSFPSQTFFFKKLKISLSLLTGWNDEGCSLVGLDMGLKGAEDIALGKHSILFASVGDLFTIFETGAASSPYGGIWVLDVRNGAKNEPIKIDIVGFPENKRIHGHGLDVSNLTDRIYFVNHHGEASDVEVLDIKYNQDCITPTTWRCDPVTLKYVSSISSKYFPNMVINDVVEADHDHVFVTRWRLFPIPVNGKQNPSGLKEKINLLLDVSVHNLQMKLTTFYLCSISDSICKIATEEKFGMANGITINANRSKLFVNDLIQMTINVFNIDENSMKLSKDSAIKLPFAVDNIEYIDEDDEIIMGTFTDLEAARMRNKDPTVKVPGGMALASPRGSGWKIREILRHDGTKLSQISAAVRYGDTVILGSPGSEGLLVCRNVKY